MGTAKLYSDLCKDLDSAENVDGSFLLPGLFIAWEGTPTETYEISQTSLFVKRYTMNRFLVPLCSINLPQF